MIRMVRLTHAPMCVLLCISMLLLGCRSTTVKEHESDVEKPSVLFKAYWKHPDTNKKHWVGGLFCQLVRKDGGESEVVASKKTDAKEPLSFTDLEPGRYRLIVRGGETRKEVEEFELESGKRVTVRMEVKAKVGKTVKTGKGDGDEEGSSAAELVAEAIGYVFLGVGVVLFFTVVLAIEILVDDDDDDDDVVCGHCHTTPPHHATCPYRH